MEVIEFTWTPSWVRKNGISFLKCEKLRRYYEPENVDGIKFEHKWLRPDSFTDYTADAETGEIIPAKRIRSKVIDSVHLYVLFADANKTFHPQIERLSMTKDAFNGWINGDGVQIVREILRKYGIKEAVVHWGPDKPGTDYDASVNSLRICHQQGHMRVSVEG